MMRGVRGFIVNGANYDSANSFVDDDLRVKFYRIGYMWQAVHLIDFDVFVYWDYGNNSSS